MNGLVLFDYDGTLVDERDNIYSPTTLTRTAVEKLQEKGYLCVLATGRAQSYIPKGARDLHLDGYITSNGACVSVHGKVIHHDVFCEETLDKLLKDYEKYDINYILESTNFCYVKDLKDPNYKHFIQNFHSPEDNFVQFKDLTQVLDKVEKITLIFKDRVRMNTYADSIKQEYKISYHRNCTTFDIAKPTIHKGVGVEKLMEHFGINKELTYAFGDGDNDVELLGSVTHGIAMRIHDESLNSVATSITGTVKEEGIYNALKKMEVI